MKLHVILALLVIFALTGCQDNEPTSSDMYFGGLIVNPTSKFVVLLKKDVVVDTFYLDNTNRFGGKIADAEKGLYVFKHPPENQITYMEPGDSTLVLLNTLEFDESLNFSGKGAAKSNYLNRMYLLNQENNNLILEYYKLGPSEFVEKTDSIRESRKKYLDKLNRRYKFSPEFIELANASINYEYYDLRERYAYLLRRYSREDIKLLPEDFHSYREEISLDDEALEDYYVYLHFIDDFIRTKSLEYCEANDITEESCYDLADFNNIKRRIILADSLIPNEKIKNNFIDRLAAQGIVYSKSREDLVSILELLKEREYNGDNFEDLRQMAGIHNALLPGRNIGELKLIDHKRDTVILNQISSKPKITYQWSTTSPSHYRWQHKKIAVLKEKYPEIDFIGINIDRREHKEWQEVIKAQGYDQNFEYKLNILTLNEELLKNYLNKLIFLDPSGEIIKGDVRLHALDHESKVLEFLNSFY
ncbi:hypothetical protein FHG64_16265 [Antarcticibacterium flavum]|uniref:Thioredoxin domain-containing protein n=1 Tax=Antarcticibacterium flavum TaxID=2058175 RepID=A0A5B7X7S4_9FLAO|nr:MULTISPECIES: hypothetical protein [Antarcticibacterium]MCM4159570.1 hypothetical protein [Antarcticibacterium sp. W02-3]QCY70822.1 hypothetical protein FHG64_16265 [Antarcticibacterium flavum]